MVRFAADCLDEIVVVLRTLSSTLGEDTQKLNIRVGIHSGSVTAGVLRGEKGRFQLFGDTSTFSQLCYNEDYIRQCCTH